MRDLLQSRIASVVTFLVGVWLVLTPLAISMTGASLVNIYIVGGIIALAGLVQYFWMNELPSYIAILAAVWAFISAFAFTVSTAAAWNLALTGVAIFLVAIWDGFEVSEFRSHHIHA